MSEPDDPRAGVPPELSRALKYVNEKVGEGLIRHHELTAHVYALTEALIGSGVIALEDLEVRKARTRDRMVKAALTKWEGAEVDNSKHDKYAVEGPDIDCASRIHLCKASCCRLDVVLTKQDLEEGVAKWDVGRPYHLRQREDGLCTHCHPTTKRCAIREQRPLTCRVYDCREDTRIWEDFEAAIPNPKLAVLR